MPNPLISVIVVCRNPGPRLREALASVWAQRDVAVDLVVIDGASTDGTAAWLEAQRAQIDTLVSEPDQGVYNAMNTGISSALGDWVLFLGADDCLESDRVFATAQDKLMKTSSDVIVGEARYTDGRRYRPTPTSRAIRRNFVHHQATFYRRRVFEAAGTFDTTLRFQADYDLNLRLLRRGFVPAPLDVAISTCGCGGLSDAGHWRNYREEITVRHRHFPAWQCWLWDAGAVVRWMRKRLVRSPSHA